MSTLSFLNRWSPYTANYPNRSLNIRCVRYPVLGKTDNRRKARIQAFHYPVHGSTILRRTIDFPYHRPDVLYLDALSTSLTMVQTYYTKTCGTPPRPNLIGYHTSVGSFVKTAKHHPLPSYVQITIGIRTAVVGRRPVDYATKVKK